MSLLIVPLHSLVLAERLDQSQQRVDQTRSFRADTGILWQRLDGQVAGCELCAGGGVGVGRHDFSL